jgi:hypothetical protein
VALPPNLIVMGRLAGDAFESDRNVLESFNKLHIQPGVLSSDFEQFGIVLLGTWRGVPLYVSEEQYEDTNGTMKYFVPEKEVLVAATGVQGIMAYAGVAQANRGRQRNASLFRSSGAFDLLGHFGRGLSQAKAEQPPDPHPGKYR